MSLHPIKGLDLHGIEIKLSRADFQNEIRDPDKSAAFRKYCDRWWVVVPSQDVVRDDLPHGCGMMWVRGSGLVVKVGAPKLDPIQMDRNMLAGLLRRASEGSILKDEREAVRQEGYENGVRCSRFGIQVLFEGV